MSRGLRATVMAGVRGVCDPLSNPKQFCKSDGELAYKRGSVVVAISRANR